MSLADLTIAQAVAALVSAMAMGFTCGGTVRWIQRIKDIA